eukprot:SM000235S08113  [mRNA]  locus=s235:156451:157265:- [translate_table: standard]
MPGMKILDVRMFETGEYALVRVLGRDPDSASLVVRIPSGEGREAGIHPDIAAGNTQLYHPKLHTGTSDATMTAAISKWNTQRISSAQSLGSDWEDQTIAQL